MARYINIDDAIRIAIQKCVDVVGHGITQVDAANIALAFEDAPTADVVPKTEVAREIFEEIDNILYKFAYPSLTAIGTINVINAEGYHLRTRDYAKLKKKYTEEKE